MRAVMKNAYGGEQYIVCAVSRSNTCITIEPMSIHPTSYVCRYMITFPEAHTFKLFRRQIPLSGATPGLIPTHLELQTLYVRRQGLRVVLLQYLLRINLMHRLPFT